MTATDQRPDRLQGLGVPLAIGVVVIGAAASLFRPAYTISAAEPPPVATLSRAQTANLPMAPADRPAEPQTLTTGRSVDAPKLAIAASEMHRLVDRGQALVAEGDFAGARLLLSRAADAGDAKAMFALAGTYDPNVLAARGARGLTGEPDEARALYERALAAGIEDARRRLFALGG